MASTCHNFKPNFWRSSTCANCYRPKREHSSAKKKSNCNAKRKGRSKSTEPLCQAEKIEESVPKQPRYHMAKHSKMVGIVRPYAVVDIDTEGDKETAPIKPLTSDRRRNSEPNIALHRLKCETLSPPLTGGVATHERQFSEPSTANPDVPRSSSALDNHAVFHVRSGRPQLNEPRMSSSLPRSSSNASSFRRSSNVQDSTQQQPPPPPPRRRMTTSASTVDAASRPQSQLMQSRHVTPKIPSPHPIRKNSSGLVRPSPLTRMTLFSRQKATSFSAADHKEHVILRRKNSRGSISVMKRKKAPPEKPPRTRSTFISISDPDDLGEFFECTTNEGAAKSNLDEITEQVSKLPEDLKNLTLPQLDPMRSSPSPPLLSSSPPHPLPSPLTNTTIMDVLTATVREIAKREVEKLVCKDCLWSLSWKELRVDSPSVVNYRGIQLSIEPAAADANANGESELAISRQIPPHLNLQLVRGVLTAPPSHPLPTLTPSPRHILRDYTGQTKLGTLLAQQRQSLDAPAYTNLVLLSLVQIFSALDHLHQSGCTHRDVGLECLYASKAGEDWLIKLGNFSYALVRPQPVTAATFTYSFSEIAWLGGTDSHLPPEVMNTPESAQTVNYSLTDSFAAGCTIYEMMGNENPFEKDTELINKSYTSDDLPALLHSSSSSSSSSPSPCTNLLQRLAVLLLHRDTGKRLAAEKARSLCQSMLWLPLNWFCKPVTEGAIQREVELATVQLVADVAKRETKQVRLSMVLKAEFLLNCKAPELMKALSVFSK